MEADSIVDVPGIRVGNHTDLVAGTGCTVVLCDRAMTGGCLVAGASPGTRETALLDPISLMQEVHAVLLTGGSAFGLDAAVGVVRYLEENGRGFDARVARVPIVPAAVLFDLGVGDPRVRPGPLDGYNACVAATSGRIIQGNAGAGTGATVGKLFGFQHATKGGLGSASVRLPGGTVVGALAAVNCAGEVVDPATGVTIAGPRRSDGRGFLSTREWVQHAGSREPAFGANTTIAVIATDARLDKAQTARLAWLAYQGIARVIRPITPQDGDAIFTLAAMNWGQEESLALLGAAASMALESAITRGVLAAESLHGVPAASDVDS